MRFQFCGLGTLGNETKIRHFGFFWGNSETALLCDFSLIRTGRFASSSHQVRQSSSFEVWLVLNNQPFVDC